MKSSRIVAFDGCVLGLAFGIDNSRILDSETGKPVTDAVGRVQRLIQELAEEKARIVIPSLVIAELATANFEATRSGVASITTSNSVDLAPIETRCAYEWAHLAQSFLAAMPDNLDAIEKAKQTSAAKKFDYGILAVVRVHRCETLYTGDVVLASRARDLGINCKAVHQLPAAHPEQSTLFSKDK